MEIRQDNLKSETGRTVRDYMLAAVEATGGGRKLAEAIGRNEERIYNWASGAQLPKVRMLLGIEEKSGVSLDEYLPEIRRGMRAVEEMRKAGQGISKRDRAALGIGHNSWCDYMRGDRAADGLSLITLFAVCRFYEGKIKPLPKPPRKKPRPTAEGELVVKAEPTAKPTRKLSAEEMRREMAYGFYKQAMGTGDARDFDFGEAADGSYRFWTAHYDGIIDLRAMELRVIFRRTGRISIRRDLHAGQAMPVPRM